MTRVNSVDDHNGGDIGPQEITMKRRHKQYRGIWVRMIEAVRHYRRSGKTDGGEVVCM